MNNTTQLPRWNSGNVTICKSRSHTDMYIIEHGNGFHNLTASYDYMVQKYPPNKLVGPKSTQQAKSAATPKLSYNLLNLN